MGKLRRRKSSSNCANLDDRQTNDKTSVREGDFARYGNTVFQVKELGEDSTLCKVLEVHVLRSLFVRKRE